MPLFCLLLLGLAVKTTKYFYRTTRGVGWRSPYTGWLVEVFYNYYMDTKESIKNSFKWSVISEFTVKIITPILNAILAHILLPEDYAPLATITMLISFCEIFVESGFKKYLIQHEFSNKEDEKNAFHVAFWTTLSVALCIWGIIAVFSRQLSSFLGNSEIWLAVAVSGCILPMYAMTGIFNATIQKQLAFKKLFFVRVSTAFIPLFVTIPLALMGLKHWSLVIGNIASIAARMFVLLFQCEYRAKFYYSFKLLRKMFSDTVWSMCEGIAVWLTAWTDSLIITYLMSDYYLGLYKNSLSTVNAIFHMVTAAVTPVLFAGLTKYQNDNKQFSDLFIRTQRILAMIIIPMGGGVFLYRDLAVMVLFGSKWGEAADVVGITALTLALRTVYVSLCSDVYKAKGAFKIPLILQTADLCLLIPTCIISGQYGFWSLVYARAIARLALIIPEMIIMKKFLGIDIKEQLGMHRPIIVATVGMWVIGYLLQSVHTSIIWQVASIVLCIVSYFCILILFRDMRHEFFKVSFSRRSKRRN